MGDGVEQGPFQDSPGLQDLGLFRLLGEVDPFHGQGGLGGEGIEQPAVVGRVVVGHFFQFDPQYPQNRWMWPAAADRGARPNQGFRCRSRPARRLRKAQSATASSLTSRSRSLADGEDFHLFPLRSEDGQLGLQGLADVFDHRLQNRFPVDRSRQIAAQIVEARGLHLALPHHLGPLAGLAHQGADDHPDDEETEKGEEILGVGYGEGQAGRDEEEIEGQHPERGGEHGRLQAEPDGGQHHRQQVDHDHVGRRRERAGQSGKQGGRGNQGQAGQVARTRGWPCRGAKSSTAAFREPR